MWPNSDVMLAPPSQTLACIAQRVEPLHIQAFVTQPPIEAFDESVLDRPTWADEAKLDSVSHGPDLQCTPCELPPVVQSDALRSCAAFLDGLRQSRSHMRAVHRAIRFQRHTVTIELIDHRQDAVGSSLRQLVADKIGRPALVRRRGNTLRNSLPAGDLLPFHAAHL